jgi:predicted CXXCH cytochrome family protein
MKQRPLMLVGIAYLVALGTHAWSQGSVLDTPHNLSATGPGTVRALTESEVCIFCHTPHNAAVNAPLWNRSDPGSTYTTYDSSTMKAVPGQPSGASRLCLSCHDGTIALGEVLSRATEIAMSGSRIPPGRALIGVDLSDDHPVSFSYADAANASGELLQSPTDGSKSLLDSQGQMQCTSCHDPHDNTRGSFLRVDPGDGALCGRCHEPTGWDQSSHATSTAAWLGHGTDPWPRSDLTTVRANACDNCHDVHRANGRFRLLTTDVEEDVCLVCHTGNVAQKDIGAELVKFRTHPVSATKGAHDPAESLTGQSDHVECSDCHNPHRTSDAKGGGGLAGSLVGVAGLDAAGNAIAEATTEYQICLKCHSDDADQNPRRILRVATQPNVRRQFDPGNPSYHPVFAAGKSAEVPSLLAEWTPASIVKCTDCHNNDSGPGVGGSGPKGPHGSQWPWLLERRYDTTTPTTETTTAYALCYKCHSRTSILSDESFKLHSKHVRDARTSCSACHDPHGIDVTQSGSAGDNTHLINFNRNIVSPNSQDKLEFIDLGRFRGTCSLLCHGEDHVDASYN